MTEPNDDRLGWLANLLGWCNYFGLFAIGIIGASAAYRSGTPGAPSLVGALYLLIGGLAFFGALLLILRRWP